MEQNDEIAHQNEEYIVLNEELQESVTKIQDINIELQKATEKAKESDRLKSAFLANMSHEIRTPLNAILGFSSLIAFDNITKEEQSQYATLIENGGNHLLRIIDDVIDISKIESNQLLIHKEKFLLTTLFSEVEKTFEIESKSRLKDNLDFRCNWPKNIDEFILYTDLIRLRQVFINLLTNAFKFTSEGYIEYGVRRSTNQTITFYVSDSGIGIDFENQKLIFDRFIQGKSKKLHEGTGLGLSITQGIITLLGGEIWVESEEGKGSTFYFTLPRVQL
jgi:signal transduction histidine kinase